jgi:hypothetical protein
VAIGQAGQVNLGNGAQQVNLTQDADRQHDEVMPSQSRRGATKPNDDSLK